jgi:DNA-binding MarR family transcriptional regulator
VSVIIANLERSGAISRRAHELHGRIQHIDLTEAGRDLLARCRERSLAVESQLASGLSPEADQAIRSWLVEAALKHAPEPEGGRDETG